MPSTGKTKTLVIILNHNLPDLTNWVYYSLKKFMDGSYDLIVMDNGSRPEMIPKYAQVRLPHNLFWGGALNEAFRMVLENPSYDSLLFLNNDIEFTPEIFVSRLRKAMLCDRLALVSPCIAGKQQPWRQMQCWGSPVPRLVRWLDMPAPMFHRKLIEKIGLFHDDLQIGWGQELVCYEACRDMGWKTAVLDNLSIIHYGKQTLLQKALYTEVNLGTERRDLDEPIDWEVYKAEALKTRNEYFTRNPLRYESLEEQVEWGLNYTYIDVLEPAKKNRFRLFGGR